MWAKPRALPPPRTSDIVGESATIFPTIGGGTLWRALTRRQMPESQARPERVCVTPGPPFELEDSSPFITPALYYASRARSIGLRAGMLHRQRPAPDFRVEKLAELARACEAHGHAGPLERGDQLAVGEDPAQLGFQARDDGGRRAPRGHDARPPAHVELGKARLDQGRRVGEHRAALARSDREQADLACLDLRRGDGERVEHEIDVAGEERGHRRGRPAEGTVQRVELPVVLE